MDNEELRSAVDFEKSIRKRNEIAKNVALGIDFAANLASALARSHGARHSINTNFAGAANDRIAHSEQRMIDAMRDYNGRRAALAFKSLLNKNESGKQSDNAAANANQVDKRLFHKPVSLMDGNVKRRPQMIEIKQLRTVRHLPFRNIMKNTNKKESKL